MSRPGSGSCPERRHGRTPVPGRRDRPRTFGGAHRLRPVKLGDIERGAIGGQAGGRAHQVPGDRRGQRGRVSSRPRDQSPTGQHRAHDEPGHERHCDSPKQPGPQDPVRPGARRPSQRGGFGLAPDELHDARGEVGHLRRDLEPAQSRAATLRLRTPSKRDRLRRARSRLRRWRFQRPSPRTARAARSHISPAASTSRSARTKAARARCIRLLTVPSLTPRIAAASR